jgi:hypothetical protein
MGIERLIPRVTSLTVDCRGVNISLTKANIWSFRTTSVSGCDTLWKEKACYCCIVAIISLWLVFCYIKFTFFKLHGTCCHFSFTNNPSRRKGIVFNFIFPIARLFFLNGMALNLRVSSTWKQAQYLRLVYYNAEIVYLAWVGGRASYVVGRGSCVVGRASWVVRRGSWVVRQ